MAKLKDFRTATKNANKHNERGLAALDQSIDEDGFVSPITTAADGEVLAGSARLEVVAEKFPDVDPLVISHDGTRPVIMVRSDIPNAQTPQAKRVAIRDNRIAEIDLEWDAGQLFEEMETGINLEELGFSDLELTELFEGFETEPPEPPEPQIDKAEELQEEWQVREGDLWGMGKFTRCLGCGKVHNLD